MLTLIKKSWNNYQCQDKPYCGANNIIMNKSHHFIIIKGLNSSRGPNDLNVYIPNNRVSNYMKQKLLQRKNRQIHSYSLRFQCLCLSNW